MSGRGERVYRGVIAERIMLKDKYGNEYPATRLHYLKPYDKPGPAKASVTTARRLWHMGVHDAYVEVSERWERLD